MKFSLFVYENSNTAKLLKGYSSSKKTYINKITSLKTNDPDELLIYSLMNSNDDEIIIILCDNLKTKFNAEIILNQIEFINDNIDYDIFYLNKYLDDYKNISDISFNKNIKYMKVHSPNGNESLMISPNGKKILFEKLNLIPGHSFNLSLRSLCKNMNNYSSHPLMFEIDMTNRNIKDEEYKIYEYRDNIKLIKPKITTRNSSIQNSLWFIFFITMIIYFIFCIFEIDQINQKIAIRKNNN